jgi:hypothetical protein
MLHHHSVSRLQINADAAADELRTTEMHQIVDKSKYSKPFLNYWYLVFYYAIQII